MSPLRQLHPPWGLLQRRGWLPSTMWPDPRTHTHTPDLRSCQQSSFTHGCTRICTPGFTTPLRSVHTHAQLCNTSEEHTHTPDFTNTQTWLYNTSEEHTYTHPTLQHLRGERVHNFLGEQRTKRWVRVVVNRNVLRSCSIQGREPGAHRPGERCCPPPW